MSSFAAGVCQAERRNGFLRAVHGEHHSLVCGSLALILLADTDCQVVGQVRPMRGLILQCVQRASINPLQGLKGRWRLHSIGPCHLEFFVCAILDGSVTSLFQPPRSLACNVD